MWMTFSKWLIKSKWSIWKQSCIFLSKVYSDQRTFLFVELSRWCLLADLIIKGKTQIKMKVEEDAMKDNMQETPKGEK